MAIPVGTTSEKRQGRVQYLEDKLFPATKERNWAIFGGKAAHRVVGGLREVYCIHT